MLQGLVVDGLKHDFFDYSIARTSFPAPMPCCSKSSTVIAARASRMLQ